MNARHIDDRSDDGYTPTTTHADFGAGNPRLRVTRADDRSEFALTGDVVRIGSAADSDLRLDGADPVHATITHDDRDEYVLELHGAGEMNSNPDADATHPGDRTQTLRTGARFTVGDWELVYSRDEFADHGRPYGGRLGGEYSDQPLQPPRPDYSDEAAVHTGAPTHVAPDDYSEDPTHSDSVDEK